MNDYLDKALDLLQEHSMESADADWPTLRAEAHQAAAGAQCPADTYPAIKQVIAALGNPHTFLITAENSAKPRPLRAPAGHLIGPVAYLLLPATPASNRRAYVTEGLKAMRDLIAKRPTGWVVDLRENGGGDMYPMLTVVSPLLGEGKTGAFVGPDGTTTDWGIRRRHVYSGKRRTFVFRRVPRAVNRPVAVLTAKRTASSGEAVLVSFLNAPNARTFGEPTAGYATANRSFPLPDGARLAITGAVMADRTGRAYGNTPIPPQTPVSSTNGTDDRVLDTAIAWLTGQN